MVYFAVNDKVSFAIADNRFEGYILEVNGNDYKVLFADLKGFIYRNKLRHRVVLVKREGYLEVEKPKEYNKDEQLELLTELMQIPFPIESKEKFINYFSEVYFDDVTSLKLTQDIKTGLNRLFKFKSDSEFNYFSQVCLNIKFDDDVKKEISAKKLNPYLTLKVKLDKRN